MTSNTFGQTASGAATGAALGAQYGGGNPYAVAAGAVIGGAAGFLSGSSADDYQENAAAWARYNTDRQYDTDIYNAEMAALVAGVNAKIRNAANATNNARITQNVDHNTLQILYASMYNDELFEIELETLADSVGVSIDNVRRARTRQIEANVADQSTSGTIIGEGSNADVTIAGMAERSREILILKHGMDIQVAGIRNEQAKGLYDGEVAIRNMAYQGQVAIHKNNTDTAFQNAGSLATAAIQKNTSTYNAEQRRYTGDINTTQFLDQRGQEAYQGLVAGLSTAATITAAGSYDNRVPGSTFKESLFGVKARNPVGTPYLTSPTSIGSAGSSLAVG